MRTKFGALEAIAEGNFFPERLEFASTAMRADRDVALAACAFDGWTLKHLSIALRDDEAVVMAAVTQCGGALEYASDGLKANKRVVLAATAQFHLALFAAAAELMFDDDVLDSAHSECGGMAWSDVIADRDALLGEPVFVLETGAFETCVLCCCCLLVIVTNLLLMNVYVAILPAVERNGMALQYVSDELRADISIVRAAFKASRGRSLCFASKSAVLYVLASNANALKYTSEVMKNDPEIVMAAIRGGTSWPAMWMRRRSSFGF